MKNIYLFLLSLLIIAMVMGGCKTEEFADNPISDQSNDIGNLNKHVTTPGPVQQLVSGLEGASGSTIGPGGALFVTEGAAGRISRAAVGRRREPARGSSPSADRGPGRPGACPGRARPAR